jgi:hypothetical protein
MLKSYLLFFLGVVAYSFLLVSSLIAWAGIISLIPVLTSFFGGFYHSIQRYIPGHLPFKVVFGKAFFGPHRFTLDNMIEIWDLLKPAGLYAALFNHSFFITSLILLLILLNSVLVLEFASIYLFGSKGLWCFFYTIDSSAVFPMDLQSTDPSASVKPSDSTTNFISDKEKVTDCNPPSPPSPPKPEVPVLRKLDALDYTVGAIILASSMFLAISILNAVFTK